MLLHSSELSDMSHYKLHTWEVALRTQRCSKHCIPLSLGCVQVSVRHSVDKRLNCQSSNYYTYPKIWSSHSSGSKHQIRGTKLCLVVVFWFGSVWILFSYSLLAKLWLVAECHRVAPWPLFLFFVLIGSRTINIPKLSILFSFVCVLFRRWERRGWWWPGS